MKTSIPALVGWLLLLSALGFYGYGIFEAIRLSWDGKGKSFDDMNFIPGIISSIQAILLTNLGAVLGISVANPKSALARQVLPQKDKAANGDNANTKDIVSPLDLKDKIQLFALSIYILSLIACLISWGNNNFVNDTTISSVVSHSGQMFFGVILAYLSLIFSRN
jgi:hypothetical protein